MFGDGVKVRFTKRFFLAPPNRGRTRWWSHRLGIRSLGGRERQNVKLTSSFAPERSKKCETVIEVCSRELQNVKLTSSFAPERSKNVKLSSKFAPESCRM